MTADKKFRIAGLVSVVVILFQVIYVFFLHSNIYTSSTNLISRVVSLILIMILSGALGFKLKKFCFKAYGWYFEIIYGALFSLIPAVLIYLFKYVYFFYRGYENLELTFNPSGFEVNTTEDTFITSLVYYILSILFVVVFKEIFYRGYLITQLSEKIGVNLAIVLQAVVYTISFVPTIVLYIINGRFSFQGPLMTIFLICGHLFFNFISGIKWGLFYKVNGSLWMAVTDHFLNNFIITSFYFTEHRLPEKWYIIEVIAIQLLSFIMFIPLFIHRDKLNEQAAAEFALNQEALKMKVDNFSPGIVRKRIDNGSKKRERYEEIFVYEEPVSLNDVNKPSEEELALSVRGYSIDDSLFDYTAEIDAHDSDPSEKSRQFFDELIGKTTTDQDNEGNQDSGQNTGGTNIDNISGLVQNYFKKNFDKHTFG